MRGPRDRAILTPEHVPIHLSPAGLGSRFLALLADAVLTLGAVIAAGQIASAGLPRGAAAAAGAAAAFVLTWGYHVYFETRREGRSPGKRLAGLRVVDGRGLPLTLQQSMVRNVVRALDFLPLLYGIGGAVCLLDRHGRRLGDIAADTLVIRERAPLAWTVRIAPARRFNSLRTPAVLRRIRRRIGLEEREFLLTLCLRSARMDPRARFDLMEEVGRHYRAKLEIEDPLLSGENLVRDLTALLHEERGAAPAGRPLHTP